MNLRERWKWSPEELTAALEASSDVSLCKPIYQKDGHEVELMDKLEERMQGKKNC